MVERLDSMSLEEARKSLASGDFGDIDSPNYNFCMAWLAVKESSVRDENATDAVKWAKHAAYAAYFAAILAAVSIIATVVIAVFY